MKSVKENNKLRYLFCIYVIRLIEVCLTLYKIFQGTPRLFGEFMVAGDAQNLRWVILNQSGELLMLFTILC